MSRFLEDFSALFRARGWNIYRVTEIVGENAPETVTLSPCNACQNSYSVAKAFVVTAIGFLWDEGKLKLDECVPDTASDEQSRGDMIADALNRFVGDLPARTRKIFVMRYWYMCTVAQIAEECSMNPNTAIQLPTWPSNLRQTDQIRN